MAVCVWLLVRVLVVWVVPPSVGCYWRLCRDAADREKQAIAQTLDEARKKFDELDADSSGYLSGKKP